MTKRETPEQDWHIACEPHPEGVVLPVRAHAGAKRQGVTGTREGSLCLSVTVAPEQGKANKAIRKELAKFLGVGPSRVDLIAGATNRQKRFFVEGLSVSEVKKIIQNHSK